MHNTGAETPRTSSVLKPHITFDALVEPDDKNVHTRSEEKRNQQLFQALEDGKLHKVHRLTEVDGEAKNLAIKTGDPHMDVSNGVCILPMTTNCKRMSRCLKYLGDRIPVALACTSEDHAVLYIHQVF